MSNQRRWCVSCLDVICVDDDQLPEVQDAMRAYCRTCAIEVLGLGIPFVGSLQHDTGGGRRVIRETKTQ